MAVIVYRSTDGSAPVLTGQVGSLTALLKACLVNGYGSKAAAGWANPFTGAAGQEVFRAASGARHYFAVDDAAPDATASFKEAQVRGWETLTAWATGTNPFPTVAQQAESGLVLRKSATADATARAWVVVADARTVYIHVLTGDTAGTYLAGMFGEFFTLLNTTDNYRSIVIGRATANSAVTSNDRLDLTSANLTVTSGHYLARTYTGLGTSIASLKHTDNALAGGSTTLGGNGIPAPDPVTGAVLLTPIRVMESAPAYRGRMRGFFGLLHPRTAFTDGDTIVGSGAYAGRTFLLLRDSGNAGAYVYDITGAWETN